MEVLREEDFVERFALKAQSFNPCFNGSVERGQRVAHDQHAVVGFNPCFNGSVERGLFFDFDVLHRKMFQSLF